MGNPINFLIKVVFVLSNWEKAMAPHSSTPAWKTHGWRSLVGCSPWGRWGSDTTEQLHFPFSLSCIREGNGNPLQCSCLENPRGGGAWWAAVYGITQSRIWLKWLSSSNGVQVWSLVRELRSHLPQSRKNQTIKQRQYCNKFNKDFKTGPHQKNQFFLFFVFFKENMVKNRAGS